MATLPNISMRLHGGMAPRQCVELAEAADAAGFRGVWFAENAFARGILPAASACAVATERLRINAGVFNPFSRHPAMMAMEIGALDELSNGRTTLCVGSGIASATAKLGLRADKPLAALRDTLVIVRGLLRGEEVDYAGPAFSAQRVKLDYRPRADIPIYLAGRGPLAIKLAGEAADGIIISNMCSRDFAREIAALMRESRRAAGHAGAGEVIQYMPCAVHRDRAAAIVAGKRMVGEMVPGFWALAQKFADARNALLTGTGIGEGALADAASRIAAGGDAAAVLDERYVEAFCLAGTPEDCLVAARACGEAGVTELALTFASATALQDVHVLAESLAGNRATRSAGSP